MFFCYVHIPNDVILTIALFNHPIATLQHVRAFDSTAVNFTVSVDVCWLLALGLVGVLLLSFCV